MLNIARIDHGVSCASCFATKTNLEAASYFFLYGIGIGIEVLKLSEEGSSEKSGLSMDHQPARGPGLDFLHTRGSNQGVSRVRSSRVGSGRVGSGRVGSGRVGSGRVGSGRVGSGRVGSGRVRS